MGYVVVITSPENFPSSNGCWVMNPNRTWNSRYRSKILDSDGGKIWVFKLKEAAEREAARVRAGDREHGPDPKGTVEVVRLEDGFPEIREGFVYFELDFGIVKARKPKGGAYGWEVYLPHSCDEWVIGNLDEVQAMMDQLAMAREMLVEAGGNIELAKK